MKKLLFLFFPLLNILFVVELASPALKIFVQPFTALLATMSISLFYLGQWNMTTFEWAYLYLWQALIMLDVFIVFLLWLKFAPGLSTDQTHDTGRSLDERSKFNVVFSQREK